mgnify:CR=1 FL=1
MSLKCGIVGLPNVGKSTLFNALTKAGIAAENYPFCTIEPNVGIVEVPDPRLKALTDIVKPKKVLPATVEFVDIAGLVAGGRGLPRLRTGGTIRTLALAGLTTVASVSAAAAQRDGAMRNAAFARSARCRDRQSAMSVRAKAGCASRHAWHALASVTSPQ